MTASIARYLQDEVLAMFIRETFQTWEPYQAKIDTIWQKILDCYFTSGDKFMTETQAYPNSDEDLTKTNVDVITKDNGELKKAVILEAKRFPKRRLRTWYMDLDAKFWTEPLLQLTNYMLKARDKDNWAHVMYGIVAVGDRVRFFKLRYRSRTLEEYVSPNLSPQDQGISSFSIHDHSLSIETVLSEFAVDIKRKRR